jgi:hypothetical protein
VRVPGEQHCAKRVVAKGRPLDVADQAPLLVVAVIAPL